MGSYRRATASRVRAPGNIESHDGREALRGRKVVSHGNRKHSKQKYVDGNVPFTTYQPAYRAGYEGHNRYPGKKHQEFEADLRREYEKSPGHTALAWDKAKHATHDAWNCGENAVHDHRD